MCYLKLQEISVASYYTANIVSDSVTGAGEDMNRTLKDIESNTENTWYSVQSLR